MLCGLFLIIMPFMGMTAQKSNVRGMGKPVTERLKAGWCQLNF